MKSCAAVVLLLGLGGCQTLPTSGPQAYLSATPPGARLVLHKPLTVPGGTTVATLGRGLKRCELEVRTLRAERSQVQPGEFRVTRVAQYSAPEVAELLMIPSLPLIGSDDSVAWYNTRLYLAGDAQPDVLYLTCGQRADASRREPLTRADFAEIVGDYMTLTP